MKILANPLFIGALLLTATNAIIERMGYIIPYINSYLDDLACFPVILTLALAFLRTISGLKEYRLSKGQVIMAVIYFSIMFEGVLPALSVRYTRDPFDIIAYAAGALLFSRAINGKNEAGTRAVA